MRCCARGASVGGLCAKRAQSHIDQNLPQLPDRGRLARLHLGDDGTGRPSLRGLRPIWRRRNVLWSRADSSRRYVHCGKSTHDTNIMLLRAIQVYARNAMLLTAPSTIEHRAARQLSDNKKKYRSGGIQPADSIMACRLSADDLGKSQPQSTILQTIRGVNACVHAIFWTIRRVRRSDTKFRIVYFAGYLMMP